VPEVLKRAIAIYSVNTDIGQPAGRVFQEILNGSGGTRTHQIGTQMDQRS
jgi:hypothetical protein